MTRILEAEPEPEMLGGLVPPAPPQLSRVAVDDGDKPPCKDCGHVWRDHGVTACAGRTRSVSLDALGHCRCTRYVKPPAAGDA